MKHVSKKRRRSEEGAHDHSHSHDHGEEKESKAIKKKATDTPKAKVCKSEGCEKKPVRKGVCSDHGGKQTCKSEGCPGISRFRFSKPQITNWRLGIRNPSE